MLGAQCTSAAEDSSNAARAEVPRAITSDSGEQTEAEHTDTDAV
jgi:hypothetical protein